ncbi:ubiquitin carboxyl-terminal hydrolase family protein [Stylonychia lemnae]|uniref:Ubiquitin carboxyl-terminal hydrolase family protein n=1 Tax=Stylonychia lemnae TaxID=5949 RepID=A0A077ZVG5_STYLE|nr:ubiquitin carboxyl-terminal hydrolase family protein [Stylonychia lemnae]|eukprot:CDW73905.1 ubiquitin carboxyl-terminal hydrolase family protein [Stylonychia lemnae]
MNFFGNNGPKPKDQDVKSLIDLGFKKEQVLIALKTTKNDVQEAANFLFQQSNKDSSENISNSQRANQQKNPNGQSKSQNMFDVKFNNSYYQEEEYLMAQVKRDSLEQAKLEEMRYQNNQLNQELIKFEPLNPDQRERIGTEPVGLKNIGNSMLQYFFTCFLACYFNSLIQAYYYIPDFAQKILISEKFISDKLSSSNLQRQKACDVSARQLAILFTKMALTRQKYSEPSDVLKSLVDDFGQQIQLGEQKDIGEFNLNFLERIEEGLGERLYAKNIIEDRKDEKAQNQEDKLNGLDPLNRKSSIADDTTEVDSIQDYADLDQLDQEMLKIRNSERKDTDLLLKSEVLSDHQDFLVNNCRKTIYEMFFGKIKSIVKVHADDQTKTITEKNEKMGPIMIDVDNYSNLYEAWNACHIEQIDDFNCDEVFFETPKEKPRCIKETWIHDIPQVLMFTLKRVNYDYKKQQLIKNNKKFEFEQTIYADKFLLKNKEKDKNLNQKVDKLYSLQKQIKDQIQSLKNNNSGLGLFEILEISKNYIQAQSEKEKSKEKLEEFKMEIINQDDVNDDHSDTKIAQVYENNSPLHQSLKDIEIAVNVLSLYQNKIQQQISKLEDDQKLVDEQIQLQQKSLQQESFHLHAILIHQGNGDGGHYYAFIKDRKTEKWYRFNDYKVSEETEEKVMQESFGNENEKTSAYGLIYVDRQLARNMDRTDMHDYNKQLQTQISSDLTQSVMYQNQIFEKQLEQSKIVSIIAKIKEMYSQRMDKITQLVNTNDPALNVELININLYLIKKANKVQLAKWLTLNQIFKEYHPKKLDLAQIDKNDMIYRSLGVSFEPILKSINPLVNDELKRYLTSYKLQSAKAWMLRYVLKNLTEKGWQQAIKIIRNYKDKFIKNQVLVESDFETSILLDVNRTFMLYCCQCVNRHLMLGNYDKMLEFLKIVVINCVLIIDPKDNHFKQAEQCARYAFEKVKMVADDSTIEKFELLYLILEAKDESLIEPEYLTTEIPKVQSINQSFVGIGSIKIFKELYFHAIKIHNYILKEKRCLTIEEWTKRDEEIGTKITNLVKPELQGGGNIKDK